MPFCPTPPLIDLARPAPGSGQWWDRCLSWIVEARSHRVICLVSGVWLINGFDLVFTLMSHQQGVLDEANPVARQLLNHGALPLILYKIGLVFIGTYPLLKFRTARVTELAALVILVVYTILAVMWSNCYEVYTVTHSNRINLAEVGALLPPHP